MLTLIIAPPLALAALWLTWRAFRDCATGIALAVAVYVLGALVVEPLSLLLGGFNLFAEDIVSLLLAAVTVLRWLREPAALRRLKPLWPLVLATGVAFVCGALWHGVKAAGVEYRSYFYFCAVAAYVASFPLDSGRMKSLVRLWLVGAGALLALAWLRWVAVALGLGIAAQWAEVGGGNRLRVLNAGQSFYLAQAFLMLLYWRRHMRARASGLAALAVLGASLLLLQHRSVWVAAGLAVAWMAWFEGESSKLLRRLALASALAVVLYLNWPRDWRLKEELLDSLETSVVEPFDSEKSTLGWRVAMWGEYLAEFAALPAPQWLVGTGLGNPGLYQVGSSTVEDAAHNYYIYTLNRSGLLGLLGLLAGYSTLLVGLGRRAGRWDYAGMLLTLLCGQLVYSVVYSPSYDQALLVGAACAAKLRLEAPSGS